MCVLVEAVTGTKTTFAEMTEKSVKCALWLREQAVQPGDIIGICTHNHLESYVLRFWRHSTSAPLATHGTTSSPQVRYYFSPAFPQPVPGPFFFLPSIKPPNEIRFFRMYRVRRSLLLSISFHFQAFSLLIFYLHFYFVLINRHDTARKKRIIRIRVISLLSLSRICNEYDRLIRTNIITKVTTR